MWKVILLTLLLCNSQIQCDSDSNCPLNMQYDTKKHICIDYEVNLNDILVALRWFTSSSHTNACKNVKTINQSFSYCNHYDSSSSMSVENPNRLSESPSCHVWSIRYHNDFERNCDNDIYWNIEYEKFWRNNGCEVTLFILNNKCKIQRIQEFEVHDINNDFMTTLHEHEGEIDIVYLQDNGISILSSQSDISQQLRLLFTTNRFRHMIIDIPMHPRLLHSHYIHPTSFYLLQMYYSYAYLVKNNFIPYSILKSLYNSRVESNPLIQFNGMYTSTFTTTITSMLLFIYVCICHCYVICLICSFYLRHISYVGVGFTCIKIYCLIYSSE
jgi:hypothetical protein